jgi:hypothetical protein
MLVPRSILQLVDWLLLVTTLSAFAAQGPETSQPADESSPAPSATQISEWIAQLDDDRYIVREKATREILDAGVDALDPLLATANADRPEPADRAVWIMRRISQSGDHGIAIRALERLVQLRDRPALVEKAETELAERSVLVWQQQLTPLGAEISMKYEPLDIATAVPMLHVRLSPQWQGTIDHLRPVASLRQHEYFRLEGEPVDDGVVKLFEAKDKLLFIELRNTSVSAEAVDALKESHPGATIYVRNQALLGVRCENHAAGVLVQQVEPGTAAAAAGIVPGDIITSIDGHALPDFDRLTARIAQYQPGDKIEVQILRNNESTKLSVTLGARTD